MAKQINSRWVKECEKCGSSIEEQLVKNTNPRDGDDTVWKAMPHDCVSYLRNRIEDLEKAVQSLKAHTDYEDW